MSDKQRLFFWMKRCWTECFPHGFASTTATHSDGNLYLSIFKQDFIFTPRSYVCEGFVLHNDVEKLHAGQDAAAHFILWFFCFVLFFHCLKGLELVVKNPFKGVKMRYTLLHSPSHIHFNINTNTQSHFSLCKANNRSRLCILQCTLGAWC